jgi:hypothetical protein
VKPLVHLVGYGPASNLFKAVAPCTSYKGEQWVAAEAANELAAQVELLAGQESAEGRVLHLRVASELRDIYHRRANRHGTWGNPLECGVFSHEVDEGGGLPADVELAFRSAIVKRYPHLPALRGLDAEELDVEDRARWDKERDRCIRELRERYVIGMLPPDMPLDTDLVQELASNYQLVLLAADPQGHAGIEEPAYYQELVPDIDSDLAYAAFLSYDAACADLIEPGYGGSRR